MERSAQIPRPIWPLLPQFASAQNQSLIVGGVLIIPARLPVRVGEPGNFSKPTDSHPYSSLSVTSSTESPPFPTSKNCPLWRRWASADALPPRFLPYPPPDTARKFPGSPRQGDGAENLTCVPRNRQHVVDSRSQETSAQITSIGVRLATITLGLAGSAPHYFQQRPPFATGLTDHNRDGVVKKNCHSFFA